MPYFEDLSPGAQQRIEKLMSAKGLSLDQAIEEVVIEAIAMGGLTLAGRPKASVTAINGPNGPPGKNGQIWDKKAPN